MMLFMTHNGFWRKRGGMAGCTGNIDRLCRLGMKKLVIHRYKNTCHVGGFTAACQSIVQRVETLNYFPSDVTQNLYAAAPEAFAFSCASSFLRAARIISSLLRCRLACLSFLSALQAFFFGCSSCSVCGTWFSLEERLYLVIRSGCDGFTGAAAALTGAGEARGAGIWKEGGACASISKPGFC